MRPQCGSWSQRPVAPQSKPLKTIPLSAASVLRDHVVLEVEGIDRMYLNAYVPYLQTERGVACFFRHHRGESVASSALMGRVTKAFIDAIDLFARENDIPVITFKKGQRKDEVAAEHLKRFSKNQGVMFIGKGQETTPVFRTEKRHDPKTGRSYAWIVRSTAMVNHYYFYCVDSDFGPFFLKFCSYFPC